MMPEWNVFLLRLCWDIAEPGLRYRKFSALVCVAITSVPGITDICGVHSRTKHRPREWEHQNKSVTIEAPSRPHCGGETWRSHNSVGLGKGVHKSDV